MKKKEELSTTYKQEDLDKLKLNLPLNYSKIIAEKIKNVVSERQVQYVINGTHADLHGIIPIALEMALEEKAKKEAIAKRMAKL